MPGMIERGWGRIINVSGLNAFKGRAEWAHVCAGKMGALGLTRALAAELAPHGIRVNHIVPGAFDTSRVEGSDRSVLPLEQRKGFRPAASVCPRRLVRPSPSWRPTERTTSQVRPST